MLLTVWFEMEDEKVMKRRMECRMRTEDKLPLYSFPPFLQFSALHLKPMVLQLSCFAGLHFPMDEMSSKRTIPTRYNQIGCIAKVGRS